jgi:voltage-gated potassium channel
MTILSIVWLILLIVEFTGGTSRSLEIANAVIWGMFILHFALEFWIAPHKFKYLKKNWLTALALILPAFRVLRAFRALRLLRTARFGRSVRLLRWVTSMNRGMKATRRTMRERGMRYLFALTVLLCFAGAAGVYVFESPAALRRDGLTTSTSAGGGIGSYGEAVWWTAMMLTTMGSDYFPKSTEGRIIAWLLAVYAFAIFGYITATVAGLIVQGERQKKPAQPQPVAAGGQAPASLAQVLLTLERIESELQQVRTALNSQSPNAAAASAMAVNSMAQK